MKLSKIIIFAALIAILLWTVGALAGDKETSLYNFNGGLGGDDSTGLFPHGQLLADQAGNLYGAALSGGSGTLGTIFELTSNGSGGWNFNLLYTCNTVCSNPVGSLVMDGAGNLYGSSAFGYVFELSPDGSGGWTAAMVYAFAGGVGGYDGYAPNPGLVLDSVGNIYGTNFDGGINNQGYVFELSPSSSGGFTLTHLHDFTGTDGNAPAAGLIRDASGKLYGTTELGGTSTQCTSGCGVVFELSNNAGTWTETVLHSFNGNDGSSLQGPLLMDSAGNLFGTATAGGTHGFGVVFEMSLVSGIWKRRDLYAFKSGAGDGAAPYNALVMDAAGNIYGTTWSGGGGDCSVGSDTGCGTAFELTNNSGRWRETLLHAFTGGGDGGFPEGLILGPRGVLYGVAPAGGGLEGGLVYELSPPVVDGSLSR